MNQLIVLHGLPGCGKSTWIKEHNLQDYAISMDSLRIMFSGPLLGIHNSLPINDFEISQRNNATVAKLFMEILETRMKNGSFTIIDATNLQENALRDYRKLAKKYRYRLLLVDFDLPLEKVYEFNEKRKGTINYVSKKVIDKMNSLNAHIPSVFQVIKYNDEQGLNNFIIRRKLNIDEYKSFVVVGDIHGCYSALMNFSFDDDKFYVFVGDYFDKGLENAKVFNWLFKHREDKNKIFLIGNHERHLWQYINDEKIDDRTNFVMKTLPEFEQAGIEKKQIRQFYHKLQQMAYISFNNKTYLVTHGGISNIDLDKLAFVNTRDFIYGVGNYSDMESVAENFNACIQVFGHRNLNNCPMQINEHNICLEGHVEELFDNTGRLRIVEFTHDKTIYHELKNPLWCKGLDENIIDIDVAKYVNNIDSTTGILERKLTDKLSSFNFVKDVFFKKQWNDLLVKARGLFIDMQNYKIVARSYDKFFNIDEIKSTELENLSNMQFPITAYRKENGYLGILSVYEDKLLFCSKSLIENKKGFAYEFHQCFNSLNIDEEQLKNFLQENNCSMLFEVIKPDFDVHIIDYSYEKLVLLDIVDNKIETNIWPYEKLVYVAKQFNLSVKEKLYEFTTYEEFYNFICKERLTIDNEIEGYVFVDMNGFMVKYKTVYYTFWKAIRSILSQKHFPRNPQFIGMFDNNIKKDIVKKYKEVESFFNEYSKDDNWKEKISYQIFNDLTVNVIKFRKIFEESKTMK